MSDNKKLARTTNVGGVTWLAGSTPPADVAEQITNPKCWEDPGEPVGIRTGVGPSEVDVERGQGGDVEPATPPPPAGGGSGDPAVDVSELKGAALDEALEKAGLAKTGSVAEKRARLEAQSGS